MAMRRFIRIIACFIVMVLTVQVPMVALAAVTNRHEMIDWPEEPSVLAESAIVLEANTGVILYEKNIHERLYPASTTKLMTCLVAAEHSTMDEMVKFTYSAVFSLEPGSSNIGIDVGQAMPMEECLYGILTASANEVAAAVAEHVAGSQENFVKMMNDKAKELELKDTHFMNPHGLYDENHYTSAYDLAIIAKAFFQNELLSKIGNTKTHHFVATKDQPDDFIVKNKHQLITGETPYDGIKGGKTGYTEEARQTLVTCAEKNRMKLICVVLKEETPDQFRDTVKLFDYGFQNFSVADVSENETKYNIEDTGFFHTSYDIFGNSKPLLSLNKDSYLILPRTAHFDDLTSKISYDDVSEDEVAEIHYYFHDIYVGTASILLNDHSEKDVEFSSTPEVQDDAKNISIPEKNIIVINVKIILLIIVGIASGLILIFVIRDIAINYAFIRNPKSRKRSIFRRRRR